MLLYRQCSALCFAVLMLFSIAAYAAPIQFVALGDHPYGADAVAGARYRELISHINQRQPAFSIHVGDFKSGSTPCSNEEFMRQRAHFDAFEQPVVYTPGDNDWTDCHRKNNGAYDPLERLDKLREIFFRPDRSLGRESMAVESQSMVMPIYGKFIENLRWQSEGVLFVTLHIVGSNNGFEIRSPRGVTEFFERDQANVDWVREAFRLAAEKNLSAVVFAFQADVFESANSWDVFPGHSGFRNTISQTLLPLAQQFKKPVLIIHGDGHLLKFDQPFSVERNPLRNVYRLEVPGERDVRAVLMTVRPGQDEPFSFELIP